MAEELALLPMSDLLPIVEKKKIFIRLTNGTVNDFPDLGDLGNFGAQVEISFKSESGKICPMRGIEVILPEGGFSVVAKANIVASDVNPKDLYVGLRVVTKDEIILNSENNPKKLEPKEKPIGVPRLIEDEEKEEFTENPDNKRKFFCTSTRQEDQKLNPEYTNVVTTTSESVQIGMVQIVVTIYIKTSVLKSLQEFKNYERISKANAGTLTRGCNFRGGGGVPPKMMTREEFLENAYVASIVDGDLVTQKYSTVDVKYIVGSTVATVFRFYVTHEKNLDTAVEKIFGCDKKEEDDILLPLLKKRAV